MGWGADAVLGYILGPTYCPWLQLGSNGAQLTLLNALVRILLLFALHLCCFVTAPPPGPAGLGSVSPSATGSQKATISRRVCELCNSLCACHLHGTQAEGQSN